MDFVVPSQPYAEEKNPMRKIQTHKLDNTFISDIKMNQTGKAEFKCECKHFDAKA